MLCASQFWQDFLANFLSDLLAGAIIGTVFGFWLSGKIEKGRENKEQVEREAKVKELVKRELLASQFILDKFITEEGYFDTSVAEKMSAEEFAAFTLPDALWSALLSGGKLSCIRDLDVLASLTAAYYSIRVTNRILEAALVSAGRQRVILLYEVFPSSARVSSNSIRDALATLAAV